MFGHRFAPGFSAVDVGEEPIGLEPGFIAFGAIGCVGPDLAGTVRRIQHGGQFMTVITGCIGCRLASDKPLLAINTDMVLVAEMGH